MIVLAGALVGCRGSFIFLRVVLSSFLSFFRFSFCCACVRACVLARACVLSFAFLCCIVDVEGLQGTYCVCLLF